MAVVTKKRIDDFFANKKIAVVGASRDSKKYGRHLFEELVKKNYDAIPVNPNATEVAGKKAYKSVKDIPGGAEAAIILVPPAEQDKVALECAQAGIKNVWLHEHVMKGISNTRAIYVCEENGLNCIVGFCPFMFMPGTAPFHKFHGAIMKFFGAYPK